MLFNSSQKRHLYPTCVCYHGCVVSRETALTFRELASDIHAHVESLERAGYEIIKASDYREYLHGRKTYDHPVTCITLDDCLSSLELIVPWFIARGTPVGLAIISRRLMKYDPEDGYERWEQVRDWVASGLVEIMSHTHNVHHLTIVKEKGVIDVAPVLESPCWLDDGDVVYRAAGDTRWYWDFSHVDRITLGLPLWGTDQYDGATPIVTTLRITPKASGNVALFRAWMSLSKPSGSGYDAQVQIRANGVLVFDGIIHPKDYETRSQWVEREFYTVTLDSSFAVTAGTAFTLEFRTLNAGTGCALIYGLCTADDTGFRAVTNARGLYPAGSQGAPDRYWQYIDYPAGDRWPVIPCLILGFGTGRDATIAEYQEYVRADCVAHHDAVTAWLGAHWAEQRVWTAPVEEMPPGTNSGPIYQVHYVPVGWVNPNKVNAVLQLSSPSTIQVEYLRIHTTAIELFPGGDADPFGNVDPGTMAEANARSYPMTLDIYVSDSASGPWTHVAQAAIWRMNRNKSVDVDVPFTIVAGQAKFLLLAPINGGPTVGAEQRCRWPIANIEAGYVTSRETVQLSDQLVYPFGAYDSQGYGGFEVQGFKDIGQPLKDVFTEQGLDTAYTIQGVRNVPITEFREPDLRQTEWAMGRWLVYGDQALGVSLNNLRAISGYAFPDVPPRGAFWQVSLEADPLGNATVRKRYGVLDYVAFDAFAFNGQAGVGTAAIVEFPVNDGRTYMTDDPNSTTDPPAQIPVAYADDKGFLQARGVKCLLIINNNLGTGDPDTDIGDDVVQNPDVWVPLMLEKVQLYGWDGVTINLEQVSPENRAAATEFMKQAARAFHAAGLLCQATSPAPTGTDYDADWWVGWCDHGEIAKYVDGLKIMSYTESGPGTDPGPAAPDWFWAAVYDRIRAIVPPMFWPRIFCGCRAFGHIWNNTADINDVDYMTYHQVIESALLYGARIDIASTEMGWGHGAVACWGGTPMTVDRAQKEAVLSGFGGIGLWKLDDGDIEEFFPTHRMIGRYEEMSFIDARFPERVSYGSAGGPAFNTVVAQALNGKEFRNSLWELPLYEFDASIGIKTQSDYEAVRNLFMVSKGAANTFRYKDWSDYKLDGLIIGQGDGATVNFQVVKAYVVGTSSMIRKITKVVAGLQVFVNGVLSNTATVNLNTGIVTFPSPPAVGAQIKVNGEFDVHVRFKNDKFPAEVANKSNGEFLLDSGSIELLEVRE